jgi:hypothetical protein
VAYVHSFWAWTKERSRYQYGNVHASLPAIAERNTMAQSASFASSYVESKESTGPMTSPCASSELIRACDRSWQAPYSSKRRDFVQSFVADDRTPFLRSLCDSLWFSHVAPPVRKVRGRWGVLAPRVPVIVAQEPKWLT